MSVAMKAGHSVVYSVVPKAEKKETSWVENLADTTAEWLADYSDVNSVAY